MPIATVVLTDWSSCLLTVEHYLKIVDPIPPVQILIQRMAYWLPLFLKEEQGYISSQLEHCIGPQAKEWLLKDQKLEETKGSLLSWFDNHLLKATQDIPGVLPQPAILNPKLFALEEKITFAEHYLNTADLPQFSAVLGDFKTIFTATLKEWMAIKNMIKNGYHCLEMDKAIADPLLKPHDKLQLDQEMSLCRETLKCLHRLAADYKKLHQKYHQLKNDRPKLPEYLAAMAEQRAFVQAQESKIDAAMAASGIDDANGVQKKILLVTSLLNNLGASHRIGGSNEPAAGFKQGPAQASFSASASSSSTKPAKPQESKQGHKY